MRRPLIIIIATSSFLTSYSQSPVDFSKFPVEQSDTTVLLTTDLLNKINWQAIKSFCTRDNGHYADESKDSLLTTYEYVKQGRQASFEIVSYKGMVLEYYADAGNLKQQNPNSYFDKNAWLKYVGEMMPSLPDQFKLTHDEPSNILKAYYKLLGVNTRDEYGFICEYSTVGRPTARREAIIKLLKEHRIDLIKKLLEYPNLQTKLYAVDALIYNDYTSKQKNQQLATNIKQKEKQLDRLKKQNADIKKIDNLKSQIKASLDSLSYFKSDFLTDAEWKAFYNLRDSNLTVKTCGNSGSYKIYGTPISELLSIKAIADIPEWYEALKKMGYFW